MFNFKTMIAALCLLLIRTNAYCKAPSYTKGLTPPSGSPCDITKNQYWCPTTKGCVEFISEPNCPQCDQYGFTNFCQEDGTTKPECCEKYDECNPSPTPVPEPDCYPATKSVTSSTEGEAKDKEMCGNIGSNGMWYCLSMKKCMRTETGTKCPICNKSGYIWNTAKSQCCKYTMSPGHFAAAQTINGNFDDASDSSCKKEYEMCANESECCAEAKYCLYEMCLACKPNGELCANNDECCNGPCVQQFCNGPSKSN